MERVYEWEVIKRGNFDWQWRVYCVYDRLGSKITDGRGYTMTRLGAKRAIDKHINKRLHPKPPKPPKYPKVVKTGRVQT